VTSALGAVVVGAGAAGLAAALDLRRRGREVLVLEAGDRPGGVMRSDAQGGFLFERGPNALRAPAPVHALLCRHGVAGALEPAAAEARLRCLFLDGRLVPAPLGPLSALRSPILSRAGKRRALREWRIPRGDGSTESVAAFVARRFGPELLERAVAPFLVGVYAGDEHALGADAVFPSLVALEREHGSVLRGALREALRRRGGERGLRGSWSAPGGLGALAERLAAPLGADLRLATRVVSIAPDGGGWRIECQGPGGGASLRAAALVLAVPAYVAAELLARVAPASAALLRGIEYAPLVSAAVAVDPAACREPVRGFGFLVPAAAKLELLGALFMSRVFAGRAPAGRELVMAMLGGARWPGAVDAPDDVVMGRVQDGLERTLGLRGAADAVALTRWPRAVAQPGCDHAARIRAAGEGLAGLPPLALAGGYLSGVAVGDALLSGERAAIAASADAKPGAAFTQGTSAKASPPSSAH
jgi:oxygen-dependent protoporphyrinogen oxidase